ncbi:MAG: UDP-4-amino-4,6-dideoxy-N-acetyl-beta-L-altrosamine transaminase [bacterium]
MKQYSYGKQSITLSDIWEVVKVLKSPYLTQGPKVQEFEKELCEYTGAKYAVAVSNGTAALHLCMLALGITNGDEVITSPITFLASANCVRYVGADVKFADIEAETALIDAELIQENITSQTKCIIPVHFAGQSCDMEKIYKIAQRNNLFVIEDAAHAIGSEYKGNKVGSCKYSDMTIFSFHPVKTLTTGEGGAITTNNKELYEKLLSLRSHGVVRDTSLMKENHGVWYHEMHELGFNYRLTDLQAALGISQLKKLDNFVEKRRKIVSIYLEEFGMDERFSFLAEKNYSKAAFHLFPLLINFDIVKTDKQEIFTELKNRGLHLQVHYIPVNTQPYYKNLYGNIICENALNYYQRTISLPLYPQLNKSDIKDIVKIIKKVVK